jgi:hypothetical protein
MPGSSAHMEFKDDLGPDLVYVDTIAGDIFPGNRRRHPPL